MSGPAIRVLALLEATSISGTAKAVLEFGYEAARNYSGLPQVSLAIANFARCDAVPTNALVSAIRGAEIPFHVVSEQGRFDRAVIPQLRSLITREAPDVIWTNSIKSHFLVRWAKLNRGRKWIAYHHGYTTTNFKMRLYNELDRWSLPGADRVLTVCQPFAKQLIQRGVDRKRVRVQHMPIRPFTTDQAECRQLRDSLGLKANERVILSVGRLSHEKGHLDLIRAFARLRREQGTESFKLILVGDGPERQRLEQLRDASQLGDAVLLTGHRDDVKVFYGMADLFVLPSYTEGSPNVLLEAMAAKVPVVATNVGGVPELVQDGVSAILVRAGDEAALASAIRGLMGDEKLQGRLTAAGLEVVAKHSPEAYYRSLLTIFEETLATEA